MRLYTSLLFFIIIVSCSTDSNDIINVSKDVSDFSNLEIGNYWVYEWYELEPNGVTSLYDQRDSIYISGDTIIAGKNLFIHEGTFLGERTTNLLFDSANMLFNFPEREILLTLNPAEVQTISIGPEESPVASLTYSLEESGDIVEVPAGRFDCIVYTGKMEAFDATYPYGVRYVYENYSKHTGLVSRRTHFYSSPNDLEMRLVSYGIKEE